MFEVIDNMELPDRVNRSKKYPDLEIGQGFIIPDTDEIAVRKNPHGAIGSIYRNQHNQRVTVRKDADGNFHVKRIA